jgi:hypothetical protein
MKTDNRISRNNGTELIELIEKAISCCRWKANFAFSNTGDNTSNYRKWKEKKKVLEDALEIVKEIRNAI